MTSADVVIIGGGVNGASVAFNLARLGVRRVVLLERRHLGAGASGKSGSTRFAEGQPWIDSTDYGIERPTISR
jgi:glycine/D-amino acid oxidase-like deaminating enzyme